MYVGVNGIARGIKKAYVGVGGIARPFFSNGEIMDYGKITALASKRDGVAGASIGDYAIFSCGFNATSYLTATDAYDSSLQRKTASVSTQARASAAGVSNENFAFICGGVYNTGSNVPTGRSTVNAYNPSLTRSTPTSLSDQCCRSATTKLGQYAFVAGGGYFSNANPVAICDTYNAAATKTKAANLSIARLSCGGASVGNYALIAGGAANTTNYEVVDVYDVSLTRVTNATLSSSRPLSNGASLESFALFGSTVMQAFNKSLTRVTSNSSGRQVPGVNLKGFAIFGPSSTTAQIDVFDSSLTLTNTFGLDTVRTGYGIASVGNYTLIGGGGTALVNSHMNTVQCVMFKDD